MSCFNRRVACRMHRSAITSFTTLKQCFNRRVACRMHPDDIKWEREVSRFNRRVACRMHQGKTDFVQTAENGFNRRVACRMHRGNHSNVYRIYMFQPPCGVQDASERGMWLTLQSVMFQPPCGVQDASVQIMKNWQINMLVSTAVWRAGCIYKRNAG